MKLPPLVYQGSLLGILGVAVLGSTVAITGRAGDAESFFNPMIDVRHLVDRFYVEEPDQDRMQRGAIDGMLDVLDDPYTVYVPPVEQADFNKELTGEYVGIGALVNIRDGWLTIASPLDDSPAFKAGIMADDRVVEIEGEPTHGKSADECVELLTGKPGTQVSIVIERAGERIPMTITREEIKTRVVRGFHRDSGEDGQWQLMIDEQRRIAYIRLSQFTPRCAEELADALAAVGAPEGTLGGLILDLRWNPGGVFQEAVAIADMFIDSGTIVSTRGRAHDEEIASATAPGTLPDFPMVVLVNGQSASAAEIVAGALQENDRAVVLGSRSFGKGLVQSVRNLPSVPGAQLKITEQRYYLPSGRCIQRLPDSAVWGVDPSAGYFVPMTDEELIEVMRVRREQEILRTGVAGAEHARWSDPDWILDQLKDKQLAAAVQAVRTRIDSGSWQPLWQTPPAGDELAARELQRAMEAHDQLLRSLARLEDRIADLEMVSGKSGETSESDLWTDSSLIEGGRLVVYDRDGGRVATLKILNPGIEDWLIDAGVEKIAEDAEPVAAPN